MLPIPLCLFIWPILVLLFPGVVFWETLLFQRKSRVPYARSFALSLIANGVNLLIVLPVLYLLWSGMFLISSEIIGKWHPILPQETSLLETLYRVTIGAILFPPRNPVGYGMAFTVVYGMTFWVTWKVKKWVMRAMAGPGGVPRALNRAVLSSTLILFLCPMLLGVGFTLHSKVLDGYHHLAIEILSFLARVP